MKPIMTIAMTTHGISVQFTCYSLKKGWGRRCPNRNTDKCYNCKYCRAEMSGKDAKKLLDRYEEIT